MAELPSNPHKKNRDIMHVIIAVIIGLIIGFVPARLRSRNPGTGDSP